MKLPALRTYAAFLIVAAQAVRIYAAGEETANGNDGQPSGSIKTPWHEPRPFIETVRHPKYDNHAYHNPFQDPNGEDLSKKRYKGVGLIVRCVLPAVPRFSSQETSPCVRCGCLAGMACAQRL